MIDLQYQLFSVPDIAKISILCNKPNTTMSEKKKYKILIRSSLNYFITQRLERQ